MSTRTINIDDTLYDYLLTTCVQEPPVLSKLRAETAKLPAARMQISPEQGRFMALLVELLGARRTIEVGVFTGYSALVVAQALPADGKVIACDVSEEWTSIGKPFWQEAGVASKIDLRIGPGVETLDKLLAAGEAGKFDFAFLDADKSNYDNYYERSLQLLRQGGLIAVDNALWSGRVADPKIQDADTNAIRALNRKIASDPRVTASMVTIGDGLLLARKR